ncbi:hypothetical protein, partial [Nocardia cyriacigeorgica]|uniref:hypothetical protein n=1 Tax=Nocardia cyriacigeorgica TaxID=135487 RepID=UPI00245830FB
AGLGGATETSIHNTICEVTDPPDSWKTVPFGVPLRKPKASSGSGDARPQGAANRDAAGGAEQTQPQAAQIKQSYGCC